MSDLISRQAVRLIESDPNAYPQEWNDDYEKGFVDALNKVLALPSAHTVDAEPKWIPCSERLPEVKGDYLVTYHPCYWDDVESEIKVGIDSFRGKTAWAKRKYQRVIAWMPLPKPYKMDGKEKSDG